MEEINIGTYSYFVGNMKPLANLTMTVRLRGAMLFRARFKFGVLLLKLAAWILGCAIIIDNHEKKKSILNVSDLIQELRGRDELNG